MTWQFIGQREVTGEQAGRRTAIIGRFTLLPFQGVFLLPNNRGHEPWEASGRPGIALVGIGGRKGRPVLIPPPADYSDQSIPYFAWAAAMKPRFSAIQASNRAISAGCFSVDK